MPQLSPVVLTDGTTDTTFSPRGIDQNGVATFVSSSGVPLADKRLTVNRSRTAANGREKVVIKMTSPVVQSATVNGVTNPVAVRTAYADVTLTFEKTSTVEERRQIRRWLQDLLGEVALTGSLVDDLESLY